MCRGSHLRKWSLVLVVASVLAFPGGKGWAALAAPTEYQLKAGFLYNFAHFIQWPANAFADPGSPLIIGVLGDDPFGSNLDEIARGERVGNHPLTVQRYQQIEDVKTCHILFVSQSEAKRIDRILMALRNRSILTVADIEGFARRGGLIRFATEKNRIRFKVNLEAAKAANLTISSKLLRAAEIITPGRD